jgi:hypothetical protein
MLEPSLLVRVTFWVLLSDMLTLGDIVVVQIKLPMAGDSDLLECLLVQWFGGEIDDCGGEGRIGCQSMRGTGFYRVAPSR